MTPPSEEDVAAWCAACGAADEVPGLISALRLAAGAYLTITQPREIGLYEQAFDELSELAVSGPGVRRPIAQAIKALSWANARISVRKVLEIGRVDQFTGQ